MGSQRVRHDLATEQQQASYIKKKKSQLEREVDEMMFFYMDWIKKHSLLPFPFFKAAH